MRRRDLLGQHKHTLVARSPMSCAARCCEYFCGETKACVKSTACVLATVTVGLILTILFAAYLPKLPDARNELAATCSVASVAIDARNTTVCDKSVYRRTSKYGGYHETVQVSCWKMDFVWDVRFLSDGSRTFPNVAAFSQHVEIERSRSMTVPTRDWSIVSSSPAFHRDTEAIQVVAFREGARLDCWYLPRLDVVSFASWASDAHGPFWGMLVIAMLGGGGLAVLAGMAIHLWVRPCWDNKPIDARPRPRDANGNVVCASI